MASLRLLHLFSSSFFFLMMRRKKQFKKKANFLEILKVNTNEEIQIWQTIIECLLCVRV